MGTQRSELVRPAAARLLGGVLLLGSIAIASPAQAAYSFSVPAVDMTVRIQPDASVDVEYVMDFQNNQYGQTIDIVDIGMPNRSYQRETMRAFVNDTLVTDVRKSEFVDPGVEVHLGSSSIRSGDSGRFTFRFNHPDLVFSDQTDDELASFRITPTWFGSEFVTGSTDLKVAIVVPPGVAPEQVLHQGIQEFTSKAVTGEGTVVLFHFPSANFIGAHPVGISFPASSMERVVHISRWQLLIKAVEENPTVRFWLMAILVVFFAIGFFRFSGGTGFVVFLIGGAALGSISMGSAAFQVLAIPGGIAIAAANEVFLRRRKSRYLPPIAEVEGGGIKRGLTAPEAAVALEEPLSKVLSLVIFGLLKKEILAIASEEPLSVRVVDEFNLRDTPGKDRTAERRKRARTHGAALRKYEEGFLHEIEDAADGKPLAALEFTGPLQTLVSITADRLAGFDLSDTQDYYKAIIARALVEAETTVPDTEQAEETLDRSLEWILLSQRPGDVFDRYHYRPPWRRRYRRYGGFGGGLGGGGGVSLPKPSGDGWKPGLGDAAGGYAGWAENVFGDLAGAILPGKIGSSGGPTLDLSGIDKVTGDVLKAMAEAQGSGGGGGGGSSCACAGCACACACAGGGR